MGVGEAAVRWAEKISGKATLDFYDEREADALTADERDYLTRLCGSNRSEAQDDRHRDELKEQPSLNPSDDQTCLRLPNLQSHGNGPISNLGKLPEPECSHRFCSPNTLSS